MNIWFFHHYASPLEMSGLQRPSLLGRELEKRGHNVTVFSASFLHYSGENLIKDKTPYIIKKDGNIPFVFIRTRSYVDSGKDRVINMFQYMFRVKKTALKYAETNGGPDVIIASSPHPMTMISGIETARKLGCSCICEIRDFWPEVIFLGGRLKQKSLLGRMLLGIEHWIYKKSDAMVFLKEGDSNYLKEHGWDSDSGGNVDLKKCFYINNGIDLEFYSRNIQENITEDEDLDSGGFNVIYAGSVRPVNNVGNILDCAKIVWEKYKDINFLIYGDGNMKAELEKRISDENIQNVKMKGYVKRQFLPYILSKSKINIMNYTTEKYNWSRGNSSNKLFEYMAAGKPVISNIKTGYDIIDKYGFGISLENGSSESLAEAVIRLHDCGEDEYRKMCENALNAVRDFDYARLTDRLQAVLDYVEKPGVSNES